MIRSHRVKEKKEDTLRVRMKVNYKENKEKKMKNMEDLKNIEDWKK